MKTVFTLLTAGLFAFAVSAQDKMSTSKDQKVKMEKKMTGEKKYWCTTCDYSSVKPGICPHHKTTLVKEGMYFCSGDEANASASMGKCKDGSPMVKMDDGLIKKHKETMKKMMEPDKMKEKK